MTTYLCKLGQLARVGYEFFLNKPNSDVVIISSHGNIPVDDRYLRTLEISERFGFELPAHNYLQRDNLESKVK